jgi:hypothetical protein
MRVDLLVLEDVWVDCIIAQLEKSGDTDDAAVAAALRRGRAQLMRPYEEELERIPNPWERALLDAEHTCRRWWRRCT